MNTQREKILKAIKQSGLTQREIAKMMGIKEAQLSRWVQGKTNPGTRSLRDLQSALNLPVNYFFNSPAMIGTSGNNNSVGNSETSKDFELINAKIEVIQKTVENIDLRLKLLENAKTTGSL